MAAAGDGAEAADEVVAAALNEDGGDSEADIAAAGESLEDALSAMMGDDGEDGFTVAPDDESFPEKVTVKSAVAPGYVPAPPAPAPLEKVKRCGVCCQSLPLSAFPPKGAVCAKDADAVEALQRALRQGWRDHYKDRYKKLKAVGEKWRQLVVCLAMDDNSSCKKKRRLDIASKVLREKRFKAEVKKSRNVERPMTWPQYDEWMRSSEGGGHDAEQARVGWERLKQSAAERDHDGIAAGVPQQLRLWVKVGTQRVYDTVEGAERSEIKTVGKTMHKQDEGEVQDFIDEGMESSDGRKDLVEAVRLCRSIDESLGLTLTPWPGSGGTGTGGGGSLVGSSAAGTSEPRAPPGTPEKGEAVAAAADLGTPSPSHTSTAAASVADSLSTTASADHLKWLRNAPVHVSAAKRDAEDKLMIFTEELRIVGRSIANLLADRAGGEDPPELVAALAAHHEVLSVRLKMLTFILPDAASGQTPVAKADLPPGCEGLMDIQSLRGLIESISKASSRAELAESKRMFTEALKITRRAKADIAKAGEDVGKARNNWHTQAAKKSTAAAKAEAKRMAAASRASKEPKESQPPPAAKRKAGPTVNALVAFFDGPSLPAAQVVEIAEVEITPAVVAKAFDSVAVGAPAILQVQAACVRASAEPAWTRALADFKAEVAAAPANTSRTGRTQKALRLEGGPVELLRALRPPSVPQLTTEMLEATRPPGGQPARDYAAKIFGVLGHTSLWCMGPGFTFLGTDFHGFSSLRLQVEGFRTIFLIKAAAVKTVFEQAATQEDILDCLRDATQEQVLALQPQPLQCTLGPNSALFVPEGFLVIERTGHVGAYGLKAVLPALTRQSLQELDVWVGLPRRGAPSGQPGPLLAEICRAAAP